MNEFDSASKISRTSVIKNPPGKISKRNPAKTGIHATDDKVTLSQTPKVPGGKKVSNGDKGVIREELVNRFRAVLADGTYVVKATEIADKIVQKIREEKNHLSP